MTLDLFRRVVLTMDIPGTAARAGDVGVVVEQYAGRPGIPPGFEVEFFAATGETIAVLTVPETSLRHATADDVLAVRPPSRG
jgi:uncharacterized protein DUF4926